MVHPRPRYYHDSPSDQALGPPDHARVGDAQAVGAKPYTGKKDCRARGIIYDRTGKVLADTRPSFNIYITPEDIKDFSQTVDGLAQLLAAGTGKRLSKN